MWRRGYDYVTWGSFSSVASAGALMGLSRAELRNAMGIAGASNLTLSVSRKGEVSTWKGVAHPYVSHNGIQACQMARGGLTGPAEVFEGPGGFFEVAAERELAVDRLGGRDGADYRILNAHVKPFPCSYYLQPIIAAVLDIVEEHDVEPDEVSEVTVRTFEQAVEILADPTKWSTELTKESADHSIPFTTAIAIRNRDVAPVHYWEEYRRDEAVHDLMGLVAVEESADLTDHARANPDSTPAVVEIEAGGNRYETRVDHAPGHARNPLPTEELWGKFDELARPLLTRDQREEVVRLCDELEELPSVDPLVSALTV